MANDFTRTPIKYNTMLPIHIGLDDDDIAAVATHWHNRRPICPYGCGEEGLLVEIVMRPEGAVGIYKDSEQLTFTAPMKMEPKPSTRKLVIGPSGEPELTEDETQ